jgi:hypothetical protein
MRVNNWLRSYTDRDYFVIGCHVLIGLALVAGTYFRLKGLGKSPFAVDEYYIASSVRNILEYGLPQFDCGGYYTRGLLLQYLVAPFFKYGSNDELYFRLIIVISNILTIPAIYLLAKRISDPTIACLAIILFCFSVWEIEMARFARMYAPFQMLFAWYLYCLYKGVMLEDTEARKWMYLISLISIFVYEGAIFLVIANFVPIVINWRESRLLDYCICIGIFILAYVFIVADLYPVQNLPNGELPPSADMPTPSMRNTLGPIDLPVLLIGTVTSSTLWTAAFIIVAMLSGLAVWALLWMDDKNQESRILWRRRLIISILIIASLFHQFGLMIEIAVLALLLDRLFGCFELRNISARIIVLPAVAILGSFIFWLSYILISEKWQVLIDSYITLDTDEGNTLIKKALVALFGYPDLYFKVVSQWLKTMPLSLITSGALVIYGTTIALIKRSEISRGYLFLLIVLIGYYLLVSTLDTLYSGMRYHFFLYSVVLLVVALSLSGVSQALTYSTSLMKGYMVALAIAFMVISEDFSIDHLRYIDSDRITYRLDYDQAKQRLYYARYDYKSSAMIVNNGLEAGDKVISIGDGIPYYLQYIDYFYLDQRSHKLMGIMACNGSKDKWSNAGLIINSEELLNMLRNATSTTWVLAHDMPVEIVNRAVIDKIKEIYGSYLVYRSVDQTIYVYRIPAKRLRGRRPRIGNASPADFTGDATSISNL